MSTKQTTNTSQSGNTSLNYNPGAEQTYNNLVKSGGNVLGQYINNPFGNAFYNLGLGQSLKGAQAQGNNATQALSQNQKVSGLTGASGNAFQAAQLGRIGRYTGALTSQANLGNVQNALSRQLQSTQLGLAFNPQLTGENTSSTGQSTSQTSGLGTWLPQLLGAGLGAAGSFFSGGASGGASSATSAGQSPGGSFGGGIGAGSYSPFASGYFGNNFNSGLPSTPSPFFGQQYPSGYSGF